MRALATALCVASVAGAACAQDVITSTGERRISWPSTRAMTTAQETFFDYARADATPGVAQAVGGMQAQVGRAPVPVLMPGDLRAQSLLSAAESFKAVEDGYFAVIEGEIYDIIINGTSQYLAVPGRPEQPADPEAYRFTEAVGGAVLSFSRYGADYIVQFECRQVAADGRPCVSRDQAERFAGAMDFIGGAGPAPVFRPLRRTEK